MITSHQHRHFLQAFFENHGDLVLLADDDARIVGLNTRAAQALGYRSEELLGRTVFEIATGSAVAAGPELWREFMQEGFLRGEFTLRHGHGGELPLRFEAVAHVLPSVHVSKLEVLGDDIPAARRSRPATDEASSGALHHPSRLSALRELGFTPEESHEAFDRLTRLASRLLHAPVSLVTLVEEDRQIILGETGLGEPWSSRGEMPLEYSYCQFALDSSDPLLIPDAREDARVRHSPAISENDSIAYAGIPLVTDPGHVVGTLCVVDHEPRGWTEEQVQTLQDLAEGAMTELRLRREVAARNRTVRTLELQAALLDLAHDMIVVRGLDDGIVRWNGGAERSYGWTRDQVLGRKVHALLDTRFPGPREEIHAELLEKGTWDGELTQRTRAGEEIIVASRWALQRDEAGRPVAVLEINRDITGRRAAEQALRRVNDTLEEEVRERTARLSLLLEQVPAIVWTTDLDLRFTSIQGAGLSALGLDPGALVGAPVQELFGPDHPGSIHDVALGGEPVSFSHFLGESAFQVHVEPLRDASGAVGGSIGIALDTSEQMAAEEAVRASERRLRALVDNGGEIVSILAADGTAIYENQAIEQVLGFAPSEIVGRNVFHLVHADDLSRVRDAFLGVVKDGSRTEVEFRFRHADGGYRTMHSVATNLLDEPAVAGVVVNSRDITEMRRAETRLRQAERMEAVGKLAGGIAHDFNNVLMVIKGLSEVTRSELPDPDAEVGKNLQEISGAADRAVSLTRQLLAFSRQQVLQPVVLDLNESVVQMQSLLERTLGADIELVRDLDPGLGHVRADPGQIDRILMNLAVNARDAMPSGGSLTTVTRNVELSEAFVDQGTEELEPGPHVLLSVSDTGTGMPEHVRERVFEPFFTTKAEKGTGMGLSTVYGIVQQSGGCIRIRSQEGAGTTFEIYLPRVDVPIAKTTPRDGAPLELETATVLLVEDDRAVRSTARRILERLGHHVLEAGEGREALRVAAAHAGAIDILFTDVTMPNMGGRELAERLVALRPGIRVLYTSGHTDEVVLKDAVREGRAAFLQKPYGPSELARALEGARAAPS